MCIRGTSSLSLFAGNTREHTLDSCLEVSRGDSERTGAAAAFSMEKLSVTTQKGADPPPSGTMGP